VVGVHESTIGAAPGMQGETNSGDAGAVGVLGRANASPAGAGSVGVRGINNGTGQYGIGVWGSQAGSGYGVYGTSPTGFGVVGESASGWAGYFSGNVTVTGTLFKGAGGFKIDHPLDPAHKFLQHSFVESPQMKDVYDGIATTDARGFATVTLPDYFQALNKDFRYQLTSLSGLQQVAVAKEIARNRFTIQSQKPHARVSWQVTGVRHDAYARAHPIKVVEAKPAADQGRYLHPELYGKPFSKRIGAQLSPRQHSYPRAGSGK
jgi:trimeric autotransporter adhesin